jgi:hypothetical protein
MPCHNIAGPRPETIAGVREGVAPCRPGGSGPGGHRARTVITWIAPWRLLTPNSDWASDAE